MSTTDLSNSFFDAEPERMANLMRNWWFSALLTMCGVLFVGVGLVLWLTTPDSATPDTADAAPQHPEQKLLNKKQLQEVLDAYALRATRTSAVLSAPLISDPSK